MREDEIFDTDLQEIVADLEDEVFGEADEAIDAGALDRERELDEILAGEVWAPAARAGAAAAQALGMAHVLTSLRSLAAPATRATHKNVVSIVRLISTYHGIPWRLGYTILQHEGGISVFNHPDGVMQTTRGVRRDLIPRIPRPLALALLDLPAGDRTSDRRLAERLLSEFPRRLGVQIAVGIQELAVNLSKFCGYVALAFQAYNAGAGWAYYTATLGRQKARPRGVTNARWENMCRLGASLLHQPVQALDIKVGVWQCDANIPSWFGHIPIYDRRKGVQLIAFKYLRSVRECLRRPKPNNSACNWGTHKRRGQGTGKVLCTTSRPGALDKLYNPKLLGSLYYEPVRGDLPQLQDNSFPLRAIGGQLVNVPPMSPPAGEFASPSV